MSNTIAQALLPEFDNEMARTRKVLEAVTPESLTWQAHENLRTVGWNANHIADSVSWTPHVFSCDEFDIAPPGGEPYQTPTLDDPAKILSAFDQAVSDARSALEKATDEQLAASWSLKSGGQTLLTMTKGDCVRTWVMNHTIHHRGILSVYLRMLGIELTPVYDG